MSNFKGPSRAGRAPLKVSALSALGGSSIQTTSPHARPIVIKIGGRALEHAQGIGAFAADVALLGAPVVIVHGGGGEVTAWSEKLGIEARFTGGLRVTDAATLDVATAVLAGIANKRMVAQLRAAGIDAVGLSAADGAVETVPHALAEHLGAVGQPVGVTPLIDALLDRGHTPVLASIGAHEGKLLNINADDVASVVARGLSATELLLLSDTDGLVIGGSLIETLHRDRIKAAIGNPDVQGGMRPKLASALVALEAGVSRAFIGRWKGPGSLSAILAGSARGTRLSLEVAAPEPIHG